MINLLEETLKILSENNKQPADIQWVGRTYFDYDNKEQVVYKCTWDDFCKKANCYYDNGYGRENVPLDLVIVGMDFWLERHEYDGSEWWEYKTMPVEPKEHLEFEVFY